MTTMPSLPQGSFDTRSGRKSSIAVDLTDATDHVQEVSYDDATQSPTAAHVHTGADSEHIVMPGMTNMIRDAYPTDEGQNNLFKWSRHGAAGVSLKGLTLLKTGAYATSLVGDQGDTSQFGGCDVLISLLMRAQKPLTAATFRFGIVDGDTDTFVAGGKVEIDQDDIPVGGFRRFYTVIKDFDSSAFVTDVSMCIALSGTYAPSETVIDVSALMFKPCNVLCQWEPGYYVTRSHDWELIGTGDVPIWDDVINFDRALYVAPA